ncbi:cytochrome c biogenesis protein CcdA [Halococcoides cellulosivorans]|uniref:Cytochrome C biogenesis protein n=1 Tax=Halococcoides cellulosivorans TaxID=1679096 RepID=A0A2R4WYC1_9EURY|nr:cytochrome c biogenesis protein CcdA [Halococcoides cellulosivorans]AWB26520.1 cytochrome C biogenesis protein [Halococcoides cellulosivorans]
MVLGSIVTAFGLGLATPLTAVCVIPLYPGFLAFLADQGENAPSVATLGALVATGVIGTMAAIGVLFTTVLETSLTRVVEVLSPPAFALLGLLGIALIVGFDPQARLPSVEPPQSRRPGLSALAYGAFFAAIVLPCNPAFIAVFFARATLIADPVRSLLNFLSFGVGMAAPLLALAVVSEAARDRVLGTLTAHRRAVDVGSGLLLVGVAAYYLLAVFEVAGPLG